MSAPHTRAAVPRAGLGMIWAQDAEGGIGLDGQMPWHLPEDMAHFRTVTRGHPVIMGRIQWESLEPRFRPLPGRENIVITRNAHYDAPGARVVTSVTEALNHVGARFAWIVGGGQIYRAAMEHATELLVTRIDRTFQTDVDAPPIGSEWVEAERASGTGTFIGADGTRFSITKYERAN